MINNLGLCNRLIIFFVLILLYCLGEKKKGSQLFVVKLSFFILSVRNFNRYQQKFYNFISDLLLYYTIIIKCVLLKRYNFIEIAKNEYSAYRKKINFPPYLILNFRILYITKKILVKFSNGCKFEK